MTRQLAAALAVAGLVGGLVSACGGASSSAPSDDAGAPEPTSPEPTGLAAIDAVVDDLIATYDLPGAAVVVLHDDDRLFRTYGTFDLDTTAILASASKWLAAATIMTLVDDGLVDLDEPIASYLSLADDAGNVSLRQLLTHSSGLTAEHACTDDPAMSLRACAALVLDQGVVGESGTIAYGSPGFQVAGAVAEVVTGQTWQALFEERISGPLGMSSTAWTSFTGELTENPDLGAGLVSTPRDYERFLAMLLDDGVRRTPSGGHRVLLRRSVEELHTVVAQLDQRGFAPGNQQVTLVDGSTLISSPGVLGARPWLVPDHGLAAILVMEQFNAEVVAETPGDGPIYDAVHSLYGVPGVAELDAG